MSMKKKVTILLALLLILQIIYGAYRYQPGRMPVEVSSTAPDATITVNGNPVEANTLHLPPGRYTFRASKDEFQPSEVVIDLSDKPLKVLLPLTPATAEAAKGLDIKKLDNYQLNRLRMERKAIEEANPIVKALPIKNLLYSVGYRADPQKKNGIIIEIDARNGYKNGAIKAIEDKGFNPVEYNITFRGQANPFKEP